MSAGRQEQENPSAGRAAKTGDEPGRLPPGLWVGILVALALAARLAWLAYTGFVEEDAFITFRYARQIASGNGFVYNPGERIDGTTTPLFTLLLAGWALVSPDPVLGARTLGLVCALGALLLVRRSLHLLGRSRAEQAGAILLLGLSSKLWLMDTQGMEMPLALLLMAASWHALVRRRAIRAGVLLGLLIWTRVDLFLWPVLLAASRPLPDLRTTLRMSAAAAAAYLPWLIFAWLYFGSPIPYTVTAKWVAYVEFDKTSLAEHLQRVLRYLSPFDAPVTSWFNGLLVLVTLGLAAWAIVRTFRDRRLAVLGAFVLLEIARLTLTHATFTNRYFVPALWAALVLAGVAAGWLWDRSGAGRPVVRWGFAALLTLFLLAGMRHALRRADELRRLQAYRHEASLKAVGLWLRDHTPPVSRVELEPLGYIGYYSERVMLDEVGLVTPAVVELKRRRVPGELYFTHLDPDYLVLHCDDALRMQEPSDGEEAGLAASYALVKRFDPLGFDPRRPEAAESYPALARGACYEIWVKK